MSIYVDVKKKWKGFSLDIRLETSGDILGILGQSGSGKSMTLRCIAGLEKPDSGEIRINDRIVFSSDKGINLTPRERRVGYLFQNYALFPTMTVLENIRFGAGRGEAEEKYLMGIIERFHLGDLKERKPGQLSGGQQQRVALARVLAAKPDLIMLDEPFSALDDTLRLHMLREMKADLGDFKGAVLFVTHNVEEAYRMSDNIAVYSGGRISAKGDRHDIFEYPPTVETARITGCKNVFRIGRTEGGLAYTDELGAGLWHAGTDCAISQGWMFIRANHIQVWPSDHLESGRDGGIRVNVLDAIVEDVIESPFRVTLFMKAGGSGLLQAEVMKDRWNEMSGMNGKNVKVVIPANRVVCI